MQDFSQPTRDELRRFLLDTVRHVCSVEYFTHALEVRVNDDEHPHDIKGIGNKLFWPVMRGMAMHYRKEKGYLFDEYILPAIEVHRLQHHHRMWNHPNGTATEADLRVGAIDTVCSLLENRVYQGGPNTYEDILSGKVDIIDDARHKRGWITELAGQMRLIEQPNVEAIKNLDDIPNIGLPENIYADIIKRADGARKYIEFMHDCNSC